MTKREGTRLRQFHSDKSSAGKYQTDNLSISSTSTASLLLQADHVHLPSRKNQS